MIGVLNKKYLMLIITVIFRLTAACILFMLNNPVHCPSVDFITYLVLLLVLNFAGIIFAILLAWFSSRGSILQPSARRHVTTLLYIRLPLFIMEFICTIFSTILAFREPINTL